jgi:cation transporter-like permease
MCLCSPAVWPCTGRATSWAGAQTAADEHLTTAHPTAPAAEAVTAPVSLAPVIDLAAYRATTITGGRVLEFARPGGGAA